MRKIAKALLYVIIFQAIVILLVACILPVKEHDVRFSENVCIIPFKKYQYRVCKDLRVKVDDDHYTIPKNFSTDLASLPKFVWPFYAPQYTNYVAPAILHDYMYQCPGDLTRQYADDVFYYALVQNDVSVLTASKFYLAVRLFGKQSFKEGVTCIHVDLEEKYRHLNMDLGIDDE